MAELARATRSASDQAGRPVAVLFDLQGPKLRLGNMRSIDVGPGEEFHFVGSDPETGEISIDLDQIDITLTDDSEIIIGDGYPRFSFSEHSESGFRARAVSAGPVSSQKGFAVTNTRSGRAGLTGKDLADLRAALAIGAEYIALSFVRGREDVQLARAAMLEIDPAAKTRLIAKIENSEALNNVAEIGAAADGLLVARGDYGVEAGIAAVPLMQKKIIRKARGLGMLVVTATQMLESMIESPQPTRAEALDVANAVFDGTSAVMLSAETAIGANPIAAVAAMAEIILAAETESDVFRNDDLEGELSRDFAIMHSAVSLARDSQADCIVVPTESGSTGRAASRFRPRRPVLALSNSATIAAQMALEWGLDSRVIPEIVKDDPFELVDICLAAARVKYEFSPGVRLVISVGAGGKVEGTNFITLRTLE